MASEREVLRDRVGNMIGSVDHNKDGSGRETLRDKNGNRMANWDPRDNHGTLRDKNGNGIGKQKGW